VSGSVFVEKNSAFYDTPVTAVSALNMTLNYRLDAISLIHTTLSKLGTVQTSTITLQQF